MLFICYLFQAQVPRLSSFELQNPAPSKWSAAAKANTEAAFKKAKLVSELAKHLKGPMSGHKRPSPAHGGSMVTKMPKLSKAIAPIDLTTDSPIRHKDSQPPTLKAVYPQTKKLMGASVSRGMASGSKSHSSVSASKTGKSSGFETSKSSKSTSQMQKTSPSQMQTSSPQIPGYINAETLQMSMLAAAQMAGLSGAGMAAAYGGMSPTLWAAMLQQQQQQALAAMPYILPPSQEILNAIAAQALQESRHESKKATPKQAMPKQSTVKQSVPKQAASMLSKSRDEVAALTQKAVQEARERTKLSQSLGRVDKSRTQAVSAGAAKVAPMQSQQKTSQGSLGTVRKTAVTSDSPRMPPPKMNTSPKGLSSLMAARPTLSAPTLKGPPPIQRTATQVSPSNRPLQFSSPGVPAHQKYKSPTSYQMTPQPAHQGSPYGLTHSQQRAASFLSPTLSSVSSNLSEPLEPGEIRTPRVARQSSSSSDIIIVSSGQDSDSD